ncbi:MAG: type IV secretory system conjugative DNA transfer family protein [Hydrogenophaga sp.]|nr:type IV secretory system conjugative DNA transfer family protein [Hydrogenophaga sp.]
MTVAHLLKSMLMAPVIAIACLLLGMAFSAVMLLVNFLIHLIGGIEHGQISHVVHVVAKYLPAVLGIGGFFSAFVTEGSLSTVFGSARWATGRDLKTLSAKDDGLLIGRDPATAKLLRYDGPAHLMTIAPTRTGKGVGTIIPNLLTADRSVICIDPKGENARVTGRARERFGPVHILDPFGVAGKRTSAFNPLDGLKPDSLDIAEDANTLADALVFDEPGMAGEAHWNEEAKALIAGLILFTIVAEPPGRRHLGTLREHLTLSPQKFAELLVRMQAVDEAGGLVARAANRHVGKSEREAAGVLSAAQRHTHFLDSPRMTAVLDRSDFRFGDLQHDSLPRPAARSALHLFQVAATADHPEPHRHGTRSCHPCPARAVSARRVCRSRSPGACRTRHGADGRLWCSALADPPGHPPAARNLWPARRHLPVECRRTSGVRRQ